MTNIIMLAFVQVDTELIQHRNNTRINLITGRAQVRFGLDSDITSFSDPVTIMLFYWGKKALLF